MRNSGAVTFLIACMVLILMLEVVRMWQANSMEAAILGISRAVEVLQEDQGRSSRDIRHVNRRLESVKDSVETIEEAISSGRMAVEQVASSVAQDIRSELQTGLRATRRYLNPEVKNYLSPDPFVITVPEAKLDGKITRWFGSEPKGLNPLTENAADVNENVYSYVQESFAVRHYENPDLWAPALAERIEITNDFREYTIYLKPGIRWHVPAVDLSESRYHWLRGDHYLTAHDVKFTVDTILNPQVECPHLRNYYDELESVEVVDDYTVIFRWSRKTYNSLTFTLGFSPIPEHIYAFDEAGTRFPPETFGFSFNQHWYNNRAIGTGPYRFVTYEPGLYIRLRRNEDYHGDMPAIREIDWLIYPDQEQNLLRLRSGEQDFGGLSPTQYRNEILGAGSDSPFNTGDMHYRLVFRPVYYYIGWNANRPIFADRRVRRAMTHAFNIPDILENVFMGLGAQVTGGFDYNSSAYNHDVEPLEYDLEKAAQLLARAGWEDINGDGILQKEIDGELRNFSFNFLVYGTSQEWRTAANIYKEDLIQIGVDMNIQALDWAIMQARMQEGDFDAHSGGWGLGWESDPYQIWHSSQADEPRSSNRIGFRNEEADKIIETLRQTFDPYERQRLYHRFHELVYEEQPYTFFYCPKGVNVWWDHVKRVYFRRVRPVTSSIPWYID